MNRAQELMNAVLDGEATPAERSEFDAMLAQDAAFAEEFESLRLALAELEAVEPLEPPTHLAHVVMGRLPAMRIGENPIQLSETSAVSGKRPDNFLVHKINQLSEILKELFIMSDTKAGFLGSTKSKALAGGGIALAALIVVGAGYDFSGAEKDATGTIVPAERYRSTTAPTANVATPGTGSTTPAAAVSGDGVGAAKGVGADKVGADRAAAEKMGADKLGADRAAVDKMGADKLGADKLGADGRALWKAGADKAGADKLGADRAAAAKLGADKMGADKLGADKSSTK